MDTVTQALLGATIGDLGFRMDFGRKALVVGAICASLPDLDLFSRAMGPWQSMAHHRAETHSIFVLTLLAPLVAFCFQRKWPGEGTLWRWSQLCWLALVTHPILDVFTTYGTQLLAPFSRHRFAIDGVAVVDLFYSVILLLGVVVAARTVGFVSSQRRFIWATFLASCLYLSLGYGFGRFAEGRFQEVLQEQGKKDVVFVRATPTLLNIALWHVVAKRENGDFYLGQVSVFAPKNVLLQERKSQQHELVTAALNSEEGKIFTWFSQNTISAQVQGRVVTLFDHRYGMPSSALLTPFRCAFTFDEKGELLSAKRLRGPRSQLDIKAEFATLWRRIWHGPPSR